MTRATPYRVHTCSAPMAGSAPIQPMPGVPLWRSHWREIVMTAILSGAVLFAMGMALWGVGNG